MKIEYILVLKENKNSKIINIKPRIQNILKKCYDNVGTKSFEIKYKRNNYIIDYECATHKTDSNNDSSAIYYLTFSYGTSKNEITASVLDSVHTRFTSKINTDELKFHMTISYDERALYFCSRAYPHFSEFESKLRCLILKLLTQTFGTLWAQRTITDEQIKNLKEKMHVGNFERIASEALYEMDFSTLESFLFKRTREVSPEYIVDNNLDPNLLKELDIDKICNILDLARPKSNWERYFADKIVIDQLEEKLTIIREERNKVAHIKHYSKKDFDEDKQILCDFNIKLEKSIRAIEVSKLTAKQGLDAIITFESFLVGLSSIGRAIKQAAKVSQTIIDTFKSEFDTSAIKLAQASMPKIDVSAIQAVQASIEAYQARMPKIDLEELQRIRTSVLNDMENNIGEENKTS